MGYNSLPVVFSLSYIKQEKLLLAASQRNSILATAQILVDQAMIIHGSYNNIPNEFREPLIDAVRCRTGDDSIEFTDIIDFSH